MTVGILQELLVVLGAAVVVTVLFQFLRLPVVLGYLVAGLLIGPHVPVPLVADPHLVHVLSELGVILLMFTIGLELQLRTIAKLGLPAGASAVFEVGLTIAAGALVAGALGFGAADALYVGACLGISSTMLVAKGFEDLGWKGGFTTIVFAILVFEDVIAVVLLTVITTAAGGAGMHASDVALLLAKLLGLLAGMLAVGLLVVPRYFRWAVARARGETVVISALALCVGLAALAASAGYSVALGAFVAGVLVAESGHSHEVFDQVRPFRDVFAAVFFVAVGMTIDPARLLAHAPAIVALTMVVLVVKPLAVTLASFFVGNGLGQSARVGLSLAQIGEFSFVIAAVAPTQDLLVLAVGVACLTTLTTPLYIRHSEVIAAWGMRRLPARLGTFVTFYDAWLGRLRARERGLWGRLRRHVLVLLLDGAAIVALLIAAAQLDVAGALGLDVSSGTAQLGQWIAAAALSVPFALGMIRRIVVIATQLAAEVIPDGGQLDLGRAPRRALAMTFELALALAVIVPMVVIVQPFLRASPLVLGVVAIGLIVLLRRRIVDFDSHLRAGSELILEVLARQTHTPAPAAPPSTDTAPEAALAREVAPLLPGLEGLVSVTLAPGDGAVGATLASLDLRARTGATVLAIARAGGGMAAPSPTAPLAIGDALALAGAPEAIDAARALLTSGPVRIRGATLPPPI